MLVIMALVSTAMTSPIVVALQRGIGSGPGSQQIPETAAGGAQAG